MKGLIYSFGLSMILAIAAGNAGAQEYTMTPDGSFVGGDSYTMTPDGSYVGGDSFTLTPDGTYVGGNW